MLAYLCIHIFVLYYWFGAVNTGKRIDKLYFNPFAGLVNELTLNKTASKTGRKTKKKDFYKLLRFYNKIQFFNKFIWKGPIWNPYQFYISKSAKVTTFQYIIYTNEMATKPRICILYIY